ncbi:unnamed protein product [Vitrella brassicaformis CCMP3155]|uniref:Conserved oligomeric Golgi complex subunit 7 n=2 Tax=Vitrella brassicaformis TaxID=1169539 RepID=A0A0G4ES15_VITBC|nr:unnamed protein product [Vitrella brassicaformis CCMP3155]|eukprot:CEM00033.1 unnamed protein product [Vitrella brassicaformis CCMP3155]
MSAYTADGRLDLRPLEDQRFDAAKWLDGLMQEFQLTAAAGTNASRQGRPLSQGQKGAAPSSSASAAAPGMDSFLSTLSMQLQMACADLSSSVEVVGSQIVSSIPGLLSDIGKMRHEISRCKERLRVLLGELSIVDTDQQESLAFLSEIDAAKGRLETCKRVLTEIHQWEYRVKEIEALLVSGSLLPVSGHLTALQETVEVLEVLPEYSKRAAVAKRFHDQLMAEVKHKMAAAMADVNVKELRMCAEVFGQLKDDGGAAWLDAARECFAEECRDIWGNLWRRTTMGADGEGEGRQGETLRHDKAGDLLDGGGGGYAEPESRLSENDAVQLFFEQTSKQINRHTQLLKAVSDYQPETPRHSSPTHRTPAHDEADEDGGLSSPHSPSMLLGGTSGDTNLPEESLTTTTTSPRGHPQVGAAPLVLEIDWKELIAGLVRTSVTVPHADVGRLMKWAMEQRRTAEAYQIFERLVQAYEQSCLLLCATPIIAESERRLWPTIAVVTPAPAEETHGGTPAVRESLLPDGLLRGMGQVLLAKLRESIAKSPPFNPSWPPSQAVYEAETDAMKVLWRLTQSGEALKDLSAALLAPVWLAGIEDICAEYWKRWTPLCDIFTNTIKHKASTLQRQRVSGPSGGVGLGAGALVPLDVSLLMTCLQFHNLLAVLADKFAALQGSALATAQAVYHRPTRLNTLQKTLKNDLMPSLSTIPTASVAKALQIIESQPPAETQPPEGPPAASIPPPQAPGSSDGPFVLAVAVAEFDRLRSRVKDVVSQCCTYPVTVTLQDYHSLTEWTAVSNDTLMGEVGLSGSPTSLITAVGEHLLSLVPHLESHSQQHQQQQQQVANQTPVSPAHGPQESGASVWLPRVLGSVGSTLLAKAAQIERLSSGGLRQLATDLSYIQKVIEALGGAAEIVDLTTCLDAMQKQLQPKGGAQGQPPARDQPSADGSQQGRLEYYQTLIRAKLQAEMDAQMAARERREGGDK